MHSQKRTDKLNQYVPQRYLRRGVFSSADLSNSIVSSLHESVCIIRFPEDVANYINENTNKGEYFVFAIQPTPLEDFRIFDVRIMNMDFLGILVDLPCNIEAYKSLDCESMFKANNINQMIYIYDPTNLPKWYKNRLNVNISEIDRCMTSNKVYSDPLCSGFITYLRDNLCWEWPAGLLPGSSNIRSRKYRNTELFDINEVIEAEQELLDRVAMPNQDMVTIELTTVSEMEQQLDFFRNTNKNSPFPIPSIFNENKVATCMGIIGKNDDLRSMITRFKKDTPHKKGKSTYEIEEIKSDISDVIFRESSDEDSANNETINNNLEDYIEYDDINMKGTQDSTIDNSWDFSHDSSQNMNSWD
ncbi:uncharacterized protein CMU_019980 [Cryptosporidium muris RN66]|uniref:TAFII55 protein conserved region domain-containing protein n=1 Tax=Cryptosporidium muris (strain RN66) TaxID=441375 RepID=B6AJB7_CRYMR|nr:uncharacterized protein CMU_019980 [Cryptosporidium muris RN66]EEA08255.1 hypothetical protein, conserved [Cryptosporidium muris RN66]|eukprot:XP_002142604.1 hypothetical protein [Cryptosporidium muris RN66]